MEDSVPDYWFALLSFDEREKQINE